MFSDWNLDMDRFSEIRVSLGCANGLEREAEGDGMICVATPVYKTGGLAGTGAHAGFVVRLPFDALVEGGFSEDQIWLNQGANEATHEDEHGPVCDECLTAAGELEGAKEIDESGRACWSCSQMIEESNADRALRYEGI
jgi:hypothetical protein